MIGLALGLVILSAPPEAVDEPPCTASVQGRVIDASTGEALVRARVSVDDDVEVETDAGGRFRIDSVCPGRHVLRARRADYQPASAVFKVSPTLDSVIELAVVLDPYEVTALSDVVVEAPSLATSDTRSTGTLTGEALERTRGRHLADAVAEVPGVTVLRSGGTAKPIVRGQSGSRVLVIFDGVRHEGQDWGLNFGTEIDPFAADTITVVKGAAGVRYGADAIAGVVLVEPPPLLDAPGLRAELHLVGAWNGRRGTVAGRVDAAPSWLPGLSVRLDGNFSRGRALETPEYPLDNTGIEEWNVGARIGYQKESWRLELSFSRLDQRAGLFTGIRTDSPGDFQAQLDRNRPITVELFNTDADIERPSQDIVHDRWTARTAVDIGNAGELELTYAYQENRRLEFDIVRQAIIGPQFDFTLRTHSIDAVFEQRAIPLAEGLKLRGRAGGTLQFQENVFQGLPLIPNYRSLYGGLFIIERLEWDDFDLEAGARIDAVGRDTFLSEAAFGRHVSRQTLAPDECEAQGSAVACSDQFLAASFTLGGIWRAADWLTSKLDFSTASRIPTIDEQFINGNAASFPILAIGDPSLKPETSWSATATLLAQTEWLSLEIAAYASFIQDYIYISPEQAESGQLAVDVTVQGAFPRFSYQAVDAVFYGAEAAGTFRWRRFEVGLNGSLVRARDVQNDAFLVFIPPDRAQASLTWRPPEWRDVGLDSYVTINGTYVARQYRFDPQADFTDPPGDYFLLGAEVGATFDVEPYQVRIGLDGSNLLDNRYRDYTSLLRYFADEPGLQLLLRVGFTFTPEDVL